jgi:hypothetical protein
MLFPVVKLINIYRFKQFRHEPMPVFLSSQSRSVLLVSGDNTAKVSCSLLRGRGWCAQSPMRRPSWCPSSSLCTKMSVDALTYPRGAYSFSVHCGHANLRCAHDNGVSMLLKPKTWLIEPDFAYCSLGGRLKTKSATMNDLDAAWKNATSLLTKPGK